MVEPRRTFCLTCQNEGRRTRLVETDRGGCCPIHEAEFIASLTHNARVRLGLHPDGPQLAERGVPKTEGRNP